MADKIDLDENITSEIALRAAAEKKLGKSSDAIQTLIEKTPEEINHELQVHQIELEMQNEELRRVQLELEESRDKYQSLYDFSPVGYFTLTHNGLLTELNLIGARLLGMPSPKLINRGFGRFVTLASEAQWYQHIISVLGHEEKQSCDLTLKREDGSTFYARLESIRMDSPVESPGKNKGSHMIRTTGSDITERKSLEEALQESEIIHRTLYEKIPGIVYRVSLGELGRMRFFNSAVDGIIGYSATELSKGEICSIDRLVVEEDKARVVIGAKCEHF